MSAPGPPSRFRLRTWLLLPHGLGLLGIALAFVAIAASGTNRSDADLILGGFGLAMLPVALVASLACLVLHPWRRAKAEDWLLLLLHLAVSLLLLAAAAIWFVVHLA